MSRQFDPEQFVMVAGDAIVAAGADGSIVLWNPAAERIFGYTESEALGQSLDLIIPERLRHRHWEGYRQVMQTGHTRYGFFFFKVSVTTAPVTCDLDRRPVMASPGWSPTA